MKRLWTWFCILTGLKSKPSINRHARRSLRHELKREIGRPDGVL